MMREACTISWRESGGGVFMATLVCVLAGCGGRGVELIQVSGTVTFDGKPVPAAGTLYFRPVEVNGGTPIRPASVPFDALGRYVAYTFPEAPGLIPGRYHVRVECWKVPPSEETSGAGQSYLPGRALAADAAPLEFNLPPGSATQVWNVDL